MNFVLLFERGQNSFENAVDQECRPKNCIFNCFECENVDIFSIFIKVSNVFQTIEKYADYLANDVVNGRRHKRNLV